MHLLATMRSFAPTAISYKTGKGEDLQLLDQPISRFIFKDDQDILYSLCKQLAGTRESRSCELRSEKKNGIRFWIQLTATAAQDSVGTPILHMILSDISERKHADEGRREALDRLQKIASQVPGVIYQFRLRPDGSSCFPFASDAIHAIYRVSPEEVREDASKVFTILHPDDYDGIVESIQASARDLTPWNHEYRVKFEDGTVRWLFGNSLPQREADGSTLWHGFITDVTERKQAEEALRESKERLRVVVDSALDAVINMDSGGSITAWNAQAEKVFGWTRQEALGQSLSGLIVPPQHRETHERGLKRYLADGVGPVLNKRIELSALRKNGEEFPVELAITPARVENAVFFSAFLRDITGRKQAEAERETLESQLRQAHKMESVGRLAGGVAHDFNNMLVVILGHTELALHQVDAAEPVHADLEQIQKAAMRSAALTRQLLAFARKQAIAPEVLDLNATVAGMLTLLRRLIGEDIAVSWAPTATLWPVKMDPSQMDQILTNLCINARDAIAGVGTIAIETDNRVIGVDFCATHVDAVPGDYVRLIVSDTGAGMDPATLAQVFEPFFTTKGVGEGTGLGLAMVYGAVRQSHGFITVASELGHGTTFEIHLLRHVGGADPAVSANSIRVPQSGQETILLVEDEPAVLELARQVLIARGYVVLGAHGPGEAIRLAQAHAGEIHLLLTDVIMPEMSGQDLADTLVSLYPQLKCLFMSGYTADIINREGVPADATRFIQKPFSIESLATTVRRVLESA